MLHLTVGAQEQDLDKTQEQPLELPVADLSQTTLHSMIPFSFHRGSRLRMMWGFFFNLI